MQRIVGQRANLMDMIQPAGCAYAPMPTADKVSDVTAAPALFERAGHRRDLLADEGYDALVAPFAT